ncbi:MAG TPA: hypothetical protein VGT44_13130 [Ktedonobacteraceae bacterium]|nr:hypothetical protein [Ktedonobacteraceae bacterium]
MPTEKQLLSYFLELLPQCKSSRTSCEEGKGKVSRKPDKGEDVCFFNFNKENQAVACLALKIQQNAIKKGERVICDCLIYFGRRDSKRDAYEETFCLVELKGSDLKHAMRQLINTYDKLWRLLEDSSCKGQLQLFTKKAYIYKHGNAPKETKDKDFVALRRKLEARFDDFAHHRDSDIGTFLRK